VSASGSKDVFAPLRVGNAFNLSVQAALELTERTRREVRGYPVDYYLARLEEVRAKTLQELGQRDDAWLEAVAPMRSGNSINNYFKWFHVLGHEINHRGRIRWLRKRLTSSA